MDSSALQAILAVSQAAAIDGGALALVNPQRAVSTVLNLTQADQLLAVYASMRRPWHAYRGRSRFRQNRPGAA